MRLVSIANVKPGQIVGRAVLDGTGRVLLQEGIALTETYIKALRAKGYTRIFVREANEQVVALPEEDVSPETRARAFTTLQKAYQSVGDQVVRLRNESAKDLAKAIDSDAIKQLMGPKGPFANIQEIISGILDDVLNRSTLAGLTSIKSEDSHVYDHSIDVCAVAIMIGRVVGLDTNRLRQLATGSLLHDVGMIFLEPEVQGRSRIAQHAKLGYELLKASEDADIMAPHVAYEHHEHQDGTGLPRGLRGSNTIERNRSLPPPVPTLVGEIAAVANLYDNLLNGTDKRDPMAPDEALGIVRRAAGTMLNRAIVMAFLRVVPVFPLGTEVTLRSGQYRGFTAVVSKINQTALDRPVVTLIRDARNKPITPDELDLSKIEGVEVRSKGL